MNRKLVLDNVGLDEFFRRAEDQLRFYKSPEESFHRLEVFYNHVVSMHKAMRWLKNETVAIHKIGPLKFGTVTFNEVCHMLHADPEKVKAYLYECLLDEDEHVPRTCVFAPPRQS